jgi:hypothetical protein
MDFGIVTSGGLNIVLSNDFSVFAEFNYLLGLQNIETKLSNQKLNNRAYSINIGLAANIK